MKRITLLIATLLTAFFFISCDEEIGKGTPDMPIIDYPYSYYEPYLMWDATKEEVMQFMSSTYPSWNLDASYSSDTEMLYIDGEYETMDMSYDFKDGKMKSCAITYPMQSDSFNQFKSDIESRYDVEMKSKGVYSGTELYFAHSYLKNMDIRLTNSNSEESLYTIRAYFSGTGPAPSDKIKFDISPSNKATLNFTDLTTITLTFPESKKASYHDEFLIDEYFYLIDSQGNEIWKIRPDSKQVVFLETEIKIEIPISMYDRLTDEGDYTFVITPNTILVDGKLLTEQRITYHLTADQPDLKPFELKFDDKVTHTDELQLHFYIPEDIEAVGFAFYGGTPIYDEENNTVGKVNNFKRIDSNHFYLVLRMETEDTGKTYHFDLAEGLITGRTEFGDIPSAETTVTFGL